LKEEKGRRTDCLNCHTKEASLVSSRTAHKPIRDKKCMWCHKPHGNANINLLHEGGGRNLCVICIKISRKLKGKKRVIFFQIQRNAFLVTILTIVGRSFFSLKRVIPFASLATRNINFRKGEKFPHRKD